MSIDHNPSIGNQMGVLGQPECRGTIPQDFRHGVYGDMSDGRTYSLAAKVGPYLPMVGWPTAKTRHKNAKTKFRDLVKSLPD